jgi:outer membrane receptor protein involved in Fe transport
LNSRTRNSGFAAFALLLCSNLSAQSLPEVRIIGTTPLPGLGQARDEVAAPVQTIGRRELESSSADDLPSILNRHLGSVHINDIQGNGLQADVNYRGYSASPLLGSAQGLSVYMDGVRVNQPFGDVVTWDTIPRFAISSITLIPGSNPLFGLNTLGGALSIETKDGRRFPGGTALMTVGNFGRRSLEIEQGGKNTNSGLHWYFGGHLHKDNGWRVDSGSDARQLFTKVGWANSQTDVKLTLAYADNELNGNGLQEFRLLDANYSSIYTRPDITKNKSLFVNFTAMHSINDQASLSGNVYYRKMNSSTLNADLNRDSFDQSVYQPNTAERTALTAAGYTGFPTSGASSANTAFPYWRCVANILLNDEAAEKCTGLINRTTLNQSNFGASGQIAFNGMLAKQKNQLTLGVGYDASQIQFTQTTELGILNPDRTVTGLGAFADGGTTGGNLDGVPYDSRVNLLGRVRTFSAYGLNSTTIANVWHLNIAGRFNQTHLKNSDQINPGGGIDSLDGDHRFSRFNPAIGLSYAPSTQWNTYFGYSEGNRAPTSVELGCANPNNPCKLPNAFAGDPPLAQVVTKTLELGIRGRATSSLLWNIGLFRAQNNNDILFVADNASGYGYFKNFGKTQRQGLELGLNGRSGAWTFGSHYTYLDATYQSAETVLGNANSSNSSAQSGTPGVDGTLSIRPGDRIPLIPKHLLKLNVEYRFDQRWTAGGNLIGVSSMFARGNENNQHQSAPPYYLGTGKTSSYAVVNLQARNQLSKGWQLLVHVNNVFNRQYATAAQLGATGLNSSGSFQARPFAANANGDYPVQSSTFVSPGAPRSIWLGVKAIW